jgi:hypothetical protein
MRTIMILFTLLAAILATALTGALTQENDVTTGVMDSVGTRTYKK